MSIVYFVSLFLNSSHLLFSLDFLASFGDMENHIATKTVRKVTAWTKMVSLAVGLSEKEKVTSIGRTLYKVGILFLDFLPFKFATSIIFLLSQKLL